MKLVEMQETDKNVTSMGHAFPMMQLLGKNPASFKLSLYCRVTEDNNIVYNLFSQNPHTDFYLKINEAPP